MRLPWPRRSGARTAGRKPQSTPPVGSYRHDEVHTTEGQHAPHPQPHDLLIIRTRGRSWGLAIGESSPARSPELSPPIIDLMSEKVGYEFHTHDWCPSPVGPPRLP